jgi:phosphatidylserine decarboxylase
MTIHKEGRRFLLTLLISIALIDLLIYIQLKENHPEVALSAIGASLLVFLFFMNFFRNPNRVFEGFEEGMIVAPADGTIVTIEPTEEDEYLKERRIQVSIFMSVFNVHANWYPTQGKITYYTHDNGRFMVAKKPKSSTENERSTIVIETPDNTKILLRQIAGLLARRIVTYSREGDECSVNKQLGFIKFGSRVDLFLPMDSEILVNMKQCVTGNKTVIARLKK